MTELAELLHQAAPDEVELAEANFDVGIIGARVRRRHRRRVGVRAAVLAGLVLAIVMSVSALRAHSGARQVDVEGGSHVTTSSALSRTTIAQGSNPTLPGPGSVVPSQWLVSLDASNPGVEVGLVSPGWACVGCNDQTGWQVALATSRDGGATWRIAGQPLPVRTTQVLPTDQVAFDAAGHGDVVVDGTAYATTDLGAHWARCADHRPSHVDGPRGHVDLVRRGSLPLRRLRLLRHAPRDDHRGSDECRHHPSAPLSGTGRAHRPVDGGALDRHGRSGERRHGNHHRQRRVVADGPTPLLGAPGPPARRRQPEPLVADLREDGGMNQGIVQLYQTTDAGAAWTLLSSANGNRAIVGTLGDGINHSLTASADDSRLWVTGIWGVRSSADGGRTWLYQANGMGDASFATVIPSGGTSAAVPIPGTGLWRTTDGLHWHH